MSECPGVNRLRLCGGAANEVDAPVEQLDGGVDRTLRRLSQNRIVESRLWVVGSDAAQRSQDPESHQAIRLIEKVLLQHERRLVRRKLADGAGDVPADVLRHVAIVERFIEQAQRSVAVLEKCRSRLVAHLPLTEHQEQPRQQGRTLDFPHRVSDVSEHPAVRGRSQPQYDVLELRGRAGVRSPERRPLACPRTTTSTGRP